MTITLATTYAVTTHATSSSVARRLPIIWGRATLTMEVSISSISDAMMTVIALIHLRAPVSLMRPPEGGRGSPARSIRRHDRVHAHAGPQRAIGVRPAREHDLDGDALN